MDYHRLWWILVVLWWRKYGADREEQIFLASCLVSIGRWNTQVAEIAGEQIWSLLKVSSMLFQRYPSCKIILLFICVANTDYSRQRAKCSRAASRESDPSKCKQS
jgi:hypothetical protein